MQKILDDCFKFVQTIIAEISDCKLGEFIFDIIVNIVELPTAMVTGVIMYNAHPTTSQLRELVRNGQLLCHVEFISLEKHSFDKAYVDV